MLKLISEDDIHKLLDYSLLTDRLQDAFSNAESYTAPERHHHDLPGPTQQNGAQSTLLLMPAWTSAGGNGQSYVGVKTVCVFPENGRKGLPAISASYLLMSGDTGQPLAVMDGGALTVWRTACTSALAARYLAKADAGTLLMVGAGALAPHLIRAHAAARPTIKRVMIWNRTPDHAAKLAAALAPELAEAGVTVEVVPELEVAVPTADIISCATLSKDPLVLGHLLSPGAHLDLVGAFKPDMRECDDEAVRRGKVFVDTWSAVKEAGDLTNPLTKGVIGSEHILGDLARLTKGDVSGRQTDQEITVFKSVGNAIEDLAGAALIWDLWRSANADVPD